MILRDKFFINGQWASPSAKEMIEVHNAGTGEVMGKVPAGTEKDIETAVAAARAALDSWSATPPAKRAEYLQKISDGLKARAAVTAASMSFSVPAGTFPITAPVPALWTSMLSLEEGVAHWPLMKNLSRRIMELVPGEQSGPLL